MQEKVRTCESFGNVLEGICTAARFRRVPDNLFEGWLGSYGFLLAVVVLSVVLKTLMLSISGLHDLALRAG